MTKILADLQENNLLRNPVVLQSAAGATVKINNQELICFCSNDYLGLANDPQIKKSAKNAIDRWGLGTGASRLVSGSMVPHCELEQKIAEFKRTEDAVVLSTGWMSNRAAITSLVDTGDVIFCDKLNHASIIDATGGTKARLRTYHHCDMDRLEFLLKKHRSNYNRAIIITDGIFSMDGDLAPIDKLVELKNNYNARLFVDDAHGTGVLGKNGTGTAELFGLSNEIDVTVGTFSKALGSIGGFIAGAKPFIDVIRNTARSYIYTTAQPAMTCVAVSKAIDIIKSEPTRREHLHEMSTWLRNSLVQAGFDILNSQTQIIPIVIGQAKQAVILSKRLLDAGFLVPAIRPPTVPIGSSRLRVSLSSDHSFDQVRALFNAICDYACK